MEKSMSKMRLDEILSEMAENALPIGCVMHDFGVGTTKELLELFESLIFQQYVPIPRYESGEPVREGDRIDRGIVDRIDVYATSGDWGDWLIGCDNGTICEGSLSQFAPHPVAAVDADGEDLLVSDAVWGVTKDIFGGARGTVHFIKDSETVTVSRRGGINIDVPATSLTHTKPLYGFDGVRILEGETVWDKDGEIYMVSEVDIANDRVLLDNGAIDDPAEFTHEEPDTYEKLQSEFNDVLDEIVDSLDEEDFEPLQEIFDRLVLLNDRR